MPVFLDTSALFKRYQPEKGTASVNRIIEDRSRPLYISSISIVEMISNLKRLCEVDRLTTDEQFHMQRDFFYQDIIKLNMTILDISADDVIKAEELILKRYMKPIDSFQLAIALNMKNADLSFVSSDLKLCKIVTQEGLKALTP